MSVTKSFAIAQNFVASEACMSNFHAAWRSKLRAACIFTSISANLNCRLGEAAEALEAKGFCKGMYTLRFEEDNTKYSPGLKDEYEIFEKLTRNRWFPCVHESFLEDKSQALYTNFWDMSLEELQIFQNWLVQNEDGSFDVDINKLILRDTWADQNCRGVRYQY